MQQAAAAAPELSTTLGYPRGRWPQLICHSLGGSRGTVVNPDSDKKEALVVRAYDDLLSPAATEVGKALAGAVRVALSPVTFTVWTAERAIEYAQEKVGERFARWRTDPKQVIPPAPEVAGPVILALRFPNQDHGLRECYLNLLARAMDGSSASMVHPAFLDVLRQVAPAEAKLLVVLRWHDPAIPLLEVREQAEGGYKTIMKHINALGHLCDPQVTVAREVIDNFIRLGILRIAEQESVADAQVYENLKVLPAAQEAVRQVSTSKVGYHHYLAEITDFGRRFLVAATDDPPPS